MSWINDNIHALVVIVYVGLMQYEQNKEGVKVNEQMS
jgi:hypothetical protein